MQSCLWTACCTSSLLIVLDNLLYYLLCSDYCFQGFKISLWFRRHWKHHCDITSTQTQETWAKRAERFQKQLSHIHLRNSTGGIYLPAKTIGSLGGHFFSIFSDRFVHGSKPKPVTTLLQNRGVRLWICLPQFPLVDWSQFPVVHGSPCTRGTWALSPFWMGSSAPSNPLNEEETSYMHLLTPTYDCARKPFTFYMLMFHSADSLKMVLSHVAWTLLLSSHHWINGSLKWYQPKKRTLLQAMPTSTL